MTITGFREHNKNCVCDPWDATNSFRPGLFSLSHPSEFLNFISSEDFVTPESVLSGCSAETLFSFSFYDMRDSVMTNRDLSPNAKNGAKTKKVQEEAGVELAIQSPTTQTPFNPVQQLSEISTPMAIGADMEGRDSITPVVPVTESFLNFLVQKVEEYNVLKEGAQYAENMIRAKVAQAPPMLPTASSSGLAASTKSRKRKRSSTRTNGDSDFETDTEDESDLANESLQHAERLVEQQLQISHPQRKRLRRQPPSLKQENVGQSAPHSNQSPIAASVPVRLQKYIHKSEYPLPSSPEMDNHAAYSDSITSGSPSGVRHARRPSPVRPTIAPTIPDLNAPYSSIMLRPMHKVGGEFVPGHELPQSLLAQPHKYLLRIMFKDPNEQPVPQLLLLDSQGRTVNAQIATDVVRTLTGRDMKDGGYVLTLNIQLTRPNNHEDRQFCLHIPSLRYNTSLFKICLESGNSTDWPMNTAKGDGIEDDKSTQKEREDDSDDDFVL